MFSNQTIRNRMVDRLDKLFYDVVPRIEPCLIGCIGYNAYGLVKTYLNFGKGFILNESEIENIRAKEGYGVKNDLSGPLNTTIHLLFNITSGAAINPKNSDRIQSTWKAFWKE